MNDDDYLDLVEYISLVSVLVQTKCNRMPCLLSFTASSLQTVKIFINVNKR